MHQHHSQHHIKFFVRTVMCSLMILIPGISHPVPLDLADIPLEVKEGVPPNIVFTMDDSGSMAWGYLPDGIAWDWGTQRFKSATYNAIFYDPNTTYLPGTDEFGNPLPNASFTSAWVNGYNQGLGTMNLATNFLVTRHDYRGTFNDVEYVDDNGNRSHNLANVVPEPAYYYVFDSNLTTGGVNCDISNPAHVDTDACYRKIVVSATSGINRYSPEQTGCSPISPANSACFTGPDERTNFANWFSYYRVRHLLAKTATTRAFSKLSNNIRVAWQMLNNDTNIGNPLPFAGAHRTNFFNWIYSARTSGWTPLTDAMFRAGVKFESPDVYRKNPSDSSSPQYSCRQNFHFAFTDGYWNQPGTVTPYNVGNPDNQNQSLPTTNNSPYGNINYQANSGLAASDTTPPIYRDNLSNHLADIAFYFWYRDLSPLENNVPLFISDQTTDIDRDGDVDDFDIFWNPMNDPADWQHMVNFTVGLGINGAIPYNDSSYQQLLDGTLKWSDNHVDDLWHAAINSRGRYLSAKKPAELVQGFSEVINAIVERQGSASSVATTSSRYEVGTTVFKAIYDPNDWSGEVIAKDVVTNALSWNAADVLTSMINNAIERNIITFDPNNDGIPFRWDDLTTDQKDSLNTFNGIIDTYGPNRLAWLRGDYTQELQNGGQFRNRKNYLGDITHSDPVYVPPPGPPLFFYPDNLEPVSYQTFVNSNANRTPMLLVGANDGMLHIFDAETGREILAYIPNILFDRLSNLPDPNYQHEYFIDETVTVWDVFYGGDWHTVAIGGLGKGGKGIYALDITNPSGFSENNAANIAMWEFTDKDDPDLGYTYTRPYIMKMNNGKWMVAFGNGYNSVTGNAALFFLDIETGGKSPTGTRIKISTDEGPTKDPLGLSRPNGISNMVALDLNNDFMVDIIYAGDYFGNLWKFDVRDPDPTKWDIFRDNTNNPKPLFIARSPSNEPQPITKTPAIKRHTKKRGYIIYVGTGSYIQYDDPIDTTVQTVYGIWDRMDDLSGSNRIQTIYRDHLLEQQILNIDTTTFTDTNSRATTSNPIRWYNDPNKLPNGSENPPRYLGWYMDLLNNGIAEGERVFEDLFVSANVLNFTTLIPSSDPCISGGESWAFRVNADSGSRFMYTSPWDYNGDGSISESDKMSLATGKDWGSGIQRKTGAKLFRTRRMNIPGECTEITYFGGADGSDNIGRGPCSNRQIKRRSWWQLDLR